MGIGALIIAFLLGIVVTLICVGVRFRERLDGLEEAVRELNPSLDV